MGLQDEIKIRHAVRAISAAEVAQPTSLITRQSENSILFQELCAEVFGSDVLRPKLTDRRNVRNFRLQLIDLCLKRFDRFVFLAFTPSKQFDLLFDGPTFRE